MEKIKIETTVHTSIEKAWEHWNKPESIQGWAFASNDWECPHAENDLMVGGRFVTTMAAKDKSVSFDFTGTYTEIIPQEKIVYTMDKILDVQNERTCTIIFTAVDEHTTHITEEFDPEDINPTEIQKDGWQAILENFGKFVESN